ncbi:MAG: NUDIX hydrolase [Deltaproteobacteria bacterium]
MEVVEPFFARLRGALGPLDAEARAPEGLRPAGVLVPLRARPAAPPGSGDEITVVLARRTEQVPHHKGQICFPGGSRDPDDPDLLATALREAGEELGIRRADVALLGAMEPVPTVTGFFIQPYVARLPASAAFRLDGFEMAEVFEAPLSIFGDPGRYRRARTTFLGEAYDVLFFDYPPHTIWGATAKILHRLAGLAAAMPRDAAMPRGIDTAPTRHIR